MRGDDTPPKPSIEGPWPPTRTALGSLVSRTSPLSPQAGSTGSFARPTASARGDRPPSLKALRDVEESAPSP